MEQAQARIELLHVLVLISPKALAFKRPIWFRSQRNAARNSFPMTLYLRKHHFGIGRARYDMLLTTKVDIFTSDDAHNRIPPQLCQINGFCVVNLVYKHNNACHQPFVEIIHVFRAPTSNGQVTHGEQ